ncbi:MAG: ABC transporter substrate-binding protein [Candidatus Binatia bacterium]
MRRLSTTIVFCLTMLGVASGQVRKPTSLSELATYTGADREQVLAEGAKKEGKVVWYTTLIAYKEIAKFFESKYSGVKVEAYRTDSRDLIKRVLTEAQARRSQVDAIETTPPGLMTFREQKLLAPYLSPHLAAYPEGTKEKASKGLVFWVTDRESFIGVGYNKNSIKPNEVPKSFDDLLKPELKGKIGISGDETGVRILGGMLRVKGEEFVRRLKGQDIKMYPISGGALNELVVSGEVAIAPSIFRNHVLQSIEKGAPVAWVPMELVASNAGGAAVAAQAQRPHAAILFVDFLISPEGQKIFEEKFMFGSPMKDYGFKRWYPESGFTIDQYEEASDKWRKLLREITRK